MSKKQTYVWQCDICGSTQVQDKVAGWLDFSIEGMIDRDPQSKVICQSCLREIDNARARMKPPLPFVTGLSTLRTLNSISEQE